MSKPTVEMVTQSGTGFKGNLEERSEQGNQKAEQWLFQKELAVSPWGAQTLHVFL